MKHMRAKTTFQYSCESLQQFCEDVNAGRERDIEAPMSDPLEILIIEETIILKLKEKQS